MLIYLIGYLIHSLLLIYAWVFRDHVIGEVQVYVSAAARVFTLCSLQVMLISIQIAATP